MKILLQRSHNAHVTWPTYGDDPITLSRHNSLRAAVRAWLKSERAMHRACGQQSWTHNYRLINADGTECDWCDIHQEMSNLENESYINRR